MRRPWFRFYPAELHPLSLIACGAAMVGYYDLLLGAIWLLEPGDRARFTLDQLAALWRQDRDMAATIACTLRAAKVLHIYQRGEMYSVRSPYLEARLHECKSMAERQKRHRSKT